MLRKTRAKKAQKLCAPLDVSGSESLSQSAVSERVRIKGLRRAITWSAGSTARRDSESIETLLVEILDSRAENEWGGVGGVSRAAFERVEDSIVTRSKRGKKHTTLEGSRGRCQVPPESLLGQRSAQRRCNQDECTKAPSLLGQLSRARILIAFRSH
jgi:hypothetical protein